MKKFIIISFGLIITPLSTCFGLCAEKGNRSAISPSGECEVFLSACDVPKDWKIVNSCDIPILEEENVNLESALYTRSQDLIKKAREERLSKNEDNNSNDTSYKSKRRLMGTGAYTRKMRNEAYEKELEAKKEELLQQKRENSVARSRAYRGRKSSIRSTSTEKSEDDIIAEFEAEIDKLFSLIDSDNETETSSVSSITTNGNTESGRRFRSSYGLRRPSRLKTNTTEVTPIDIQDRIKLNRLWKGDRLEGSLEGEIEDTIPDDLNQEEE